MAPARKRAAARPAPPRPSFERTVARSRGMARALEALRHAAPLRVPVLLEGEEGTGKRWLAEALHAASPRAARPFVALACGALPHEAFERALLGAGEGREGEPGAVGRADGGTLFLGDVHALAMPTQARLLRLLQERTYERVGARESRRADVRLVAATPRDLEAESAAGRFHEDLLARLASVRVRVPALRERAEDLPPLVQALLDELNREHRRQARDLTLGAYERLRRAEWPGNVRELRGVLEGMVVFAGRRRALEVSDLPAALRESAAPGERLDLAVGMTTSEGERRLIAATLRMTGYDKPRAAALLGIGLRTLYRKIERYGLG